MSRVTSWLTIHEGVRRDEREQDFFQVLVGAYEPARGAADRAGVSVVREATEVKLEHLPRDAFADLGAPGELLSQFTKALETPSRVAIPAMLPVLSMGNVPSVSRYRPMPSKFSRPKPMGSICKWQPEHAGSVACCS